MIKCTVKTIDKDYLTKHIEEMNKALKKSPYVKIGFQGQKGEALHRVPKGETPKASVVDIATFHEFGAPGANIPERSIIRSVVDEKDAEFKYYIDKLRWEMYTDKTMTTFKALSLLGLNIQKYIQAWFTQNDWEALKDPTRGGKNFEGGGKPLLDTGQLRASVTYVVENKS